MIRRSAGVVLVVKAEDDKHVRMVIPEMGRVSVLHLRSIPRYLQSLIHDMFSVATPRLEALRLSAESPLVNGRVRLHMPDSIFARHSHTLRLLELTLCDFSWPSLLCLSSLAHLELCDPATRPTMAQVLALCRLPMLETLILDQSLPAHDDTDTTSSRHFLPNLHILTLSGRLESCSNVLNHITYPITTIATFNCDTFSRESLPLTHFLQTAHSAIIYKRDDHIVHSLGYEANSDRFFLTFLVVRRSSTPFPHQKPQLSVSIRRNVDHLITKFVHPAVATLSLVEVQALYLSIPWCFQINWSEFIQRLPKISALHLGRDFPSGFMKILSQNENENPRPRPLPLAHLRGLWLTGTHFYRESVRSLLACLQSRAQVGLAIQELHLKDCWYLFKHDVEQMKGFVHDVDWDEVEQVEYPESGRDFEDYESDYDPDYCVYYYG